MSGKERNPNHDPKTGEFTTGLGVGNSEKTGKFVSLKRDSQRFMDDPTYEYSRNYDPSIMTGMKEATTAKALRDSAKAKKFADVGLKNARAEDRAAVLRSSKQRALRSK